MRALLIGVLAVSVAGCTFGVKTCSDTSECGSGATCEQGFCVAIIGDTGGGSGGGGGTTTTGGGSGGGTAQGGGSGGGAQGGGGGQSVCQTLNCSEACIEPTGCVAYFGSIELVTPDAGARVKEGMVALEARMTPNPGVTVTDTMLPTALSYTAADGGVTQLLKVADTNLYTTTFTLSGCGASTEFDGTVSLEDGGLPVQSSFTCDGKAPTITWAGIANGNQFKRDTVLITELNSDEPVMNTVVTLAGTVVEASLVGIDGGACSALAGCWKVDFSKPSLSAMSQQWDLITQSTDAVGNPNTVQLQVGVTRERWMVRLTTSALNAAPAVGAGGYIYTGSSNGTDTGTVYRVNPLTGETDAGFAIGAVQGVALAKSGGTEFLFVALNNGTNGQLFGRSTDDLSATSGLRVPCESNGNTFIRVAPALVFVPDGDGGGEVAAVAASNNNGGTPGLFLRWTPSANSCLGPAVTNNLNAETLTPPINVVVANAVAAPAARFVRNVSGAWALREVSDIVANPALSTSTIDFDGGGARAQVLVNGNSLVSEVQASEWNGISDFRNLRSLISTVPGVSGVSWTYAGPWGTVVAPAVSSLGTPAIFNASSGYVGFGTHVMQFSPSAPGALADADFVPGVTATTDIKAAPVLLAPVDGVSWAYVVDANGQIGAFATQGGGAPWFSQDATPHAVAAHPGFGCNTREGAAQNTGILYVASTDGYLRAIIVDGKSLSEATGAWPKYQRTMGNAGNDDTSNFRTNGACP